MTRQTASTLIVVGILLMTSIVTRSAAAGTAPPQTASPGGTAGFAKISNPCPTFSWGAVAGADRYDLALYSFDEDELVGARPSLYQSLPGSVTGWTPDSARCPEPGRRYVWAVRALVDDMETDWSESRLFLLADVPSVKDVEEALALLRRYLEEEASSGSPGDAAEYHSRSAAYEGSFDATPGDPARTLRHQPDSEPLESAPVELRRLMPGREIGTDSKGGGALFSGAPGAAISPRTVTLAPDYSLATESDFVLEGNVFQDGYPLLHTDGGIEFANTALGLDALVSTTIGSPDPLDGVFNTALGSRALRNTTEGFVNTGLGAFSLYYNTAGDYNTALGGLAMFQNTDGARNTAVGVRALQNSSTGDDNTAVGNRALYGSGSGVSNTAVGSYALRSTTTASWNTAVGSRALRYNTGSWGTAVGENALGSNTTGISNTAVGYGAQQYGTTAIANVAIGTLAASGIITGDSNVAIGWSAQVGRDENSNIAIGANSGGTDIGDNNIYLGGPATVDDENTIRIGDRAIHTTTVVAGVRGTNVANGLSVLVGSLGRLGTTTSSRRFKEEIEKMGDASEGLLALRPVTFRYRRDAVPEGPRPIEFGLIAEEVAEIYPDLVAYDEEGKPTSVRYHVLPTMLLNELQKQHLLMMAQRGELARLRERLRALETSH